MRLLYPDVQKEFYFTNVTQFVSPATWFSRYTERECVKQRNSFIQQAGSVCVKCFLCLTVVQIDENKVTLKQFRLNIQN